MSYPEHERLRALDGANQTVGEFLEWLDGQGIQLAVYRYPVEMQVCVDIGDMGRSERRQLEEVIETRDCAAIVEWLEEHDYDDKYIVSGSTYGWGIEPWGKWIALPDPADPSEPWYFTGYRDDLLFPLRERWESLIGRFFDIDPVKIADEKDQMLADIRARDAA